MTPRTAAKNVANKDKNSGEAFKFPEEAGSTPDNNEKAGRESKKEEEMHSKDELYEMLQTKNEEIEDLKEQFEAC